MSQLPHFYAPQIYTPAQSNQTHGFLKAVHLPRELYSEHHLNVPHEVYPEEVVRTHSCPSVQSVEDPKQENKSLQEKRKKNREAAAACRQRRLDLIGKLEQNVEHLENEIIELHRVMDLLTQKNESLAELLETHNIRIPKTLLAKFDRKIDDLLQNSVLKKIPKIVNQPLKRGRKRKVDTMDGIKEEPITPKLFGLEKNNKKEDNRELISNNIALPLLPETSFDARQQFNEAVRNANIFNQPLPTLTQQEENTERPKDLIINNNSQGCTLTLFSFNTPTVRHLNLFCQQTGITPIATLPKMVVPTDRDHPAKDNELHSL